MTVPSMLSWLVLDRRGCGGRPFRPQAGQDGGENQSTHYRYMLLRPELLDKCGFAREVPEIMSDRDGGQRKKRERTRAQPREASSEYHERRAGKLKDHSRCRKEPWRVEAEVRHLRLGAGEIE